MSTITEITVPASEFALGSAFEDVPGMEVEFDRAVARDCAQPMTYIWIRASSPVRTTAALRADPSIEELTLVTDLDDKQLYSVRWCEETDEAIETLLSENSSILEAIGVDGSWRFRLLFPDRQRVSSFYTGCRNGGPSVDFRTIGSHTESPWCEKRHLSDKQRGSLRSALELGYYDVPRTITLSELAIDLDVSHQALSERLRRGHSRIVEEALSADRTDSANSV